MDNNNLVEDILSIIKVQSQDITDLQDKVVALTAKLDKTDDEMGKYLNIVDRVLTLGERMNKYLIYLKNVIEGKRNSNRGFPPININ